MNRKMDELLYFIAALILTVVLTACGKSKSPSKEQQAADSYDYSVIETAPVYVDSFKGFLDKCQPESKDLSNTHR